MQVEPFSRVPEETAAKAAASLSRVTGFSMTASGFDLPRPMRSSTSSAAQPVTKTMGRPGWSTRMQASKFAEIPRYGREATGHIAIQNHGDPVAFRNLKIRRLP